MVPFGKLTLERERAGTDREYVGVLITALACMTHAKSGRPRIAPLDHDVEGLLPLNTFRTLEYEFGQHPHGPRSRRYRRGG